MATQTMDYPCKGIEIEPGKFSGCDAHKTGRNDCPVCGERPFRIIETHNDAHKKVWAIATGISGVYCESFLFVEVAKIACSWGNHGYAKAITDLSASAARVAELENDLTEAAATFDTIANAVDAPHFDTERKYAIRDKATHTAKAIRERLARKGK